MGALKFILHYTINKCKGKEAVVVKDDNNNGCSGKGIVGV